MRKLLEKWMVARADLGLDIVAPFVLRLSADQELKADFLVTKFGGRQGMLIVTDYAQVKPYVDRLHSLGYGFCVLEEPRDSFNQTYDRETFVDLLSDWGWAGSQADKPQWLREI